MSRIISALIFLTLCLTLSSPVHVDATIPSIDFTGLLNQFTANGTSWCTTCGAFPTKCPMGCAGDNGGGGTCPADACPRVFTFTQQNNIPIWNIDVATNANPYRAFSYIPICTNSTQCTEPFVFSFSVKYTPNATATLPIFNNQFDYLKLLFWGDGNNILGIKQGQLLGLPYGGVTDLVGSTTIGTGQAFQTPFPVNAWTNIAVQLTFNNSNSRATLAFYVNGTAVGLTNTTIGTATSGLQFGTYTWGGTFYTIQYTNINITAANVIPNPNMNGGGVTPVTQAPTPSPATLAPNTTQAPSTTPPTQAPNTTQAPTPVPSQSSSLPASSSSNLVVLFLFSCFLLYWQ